MGNDLCACDQKQKTAHNLDVPTSPSNLYLEYYQPADSRKALGSQVTNETDKSLSLGFHKAIERLKTGIDGKPQSVRLKAERAHPQPTHPTESSQRHSNTSTSYREEPTAALSLTDPSSQSEIWMEGELLKYKPGLSTNFVSRWCQVTANHFRYYRNQWHARVWEHKPIFAISFRHIVAVKRHRPSQEEKIHLFGPTHTHLFHIILTEEATRCLTPERKSQESTEVIPKSRQAWSSRSQEWSTQRLLFCAKSGEEVTAWVTIFSTCKQ